MTPEMEVGTIASVDVAAALRCDSPNHTSAGTITVPPPMPNMPDSSPTITPTATNIATARAPRASPSSVPLLVSVISRSFSARYYSSPPNPTQTSTSPRPYRSADKSGT